MQEERISVGLIGNPNSGKSSLFNLLTGLRQHVSNFPGVTVDKKIGVAVLEDGKKIDIIDFPGTYSLHPNSSDERLVIDILTDPESPDYPDLIVYVADITQIERHLLMATQIIDLGIPMIMCLNMEDLIDESHKLTVVKKIEDLLGVTTILVSGKSGKNINVVKSSISYFLASKKTGLPNPFYQLSEEERKAAEVVKEFTHFDNNYLNKIIAHHHNWLPHLSKEAKLNIASGLSHFSFEDIKNQIEETLSRFKKISPVTSDILKTKGDKTVSFTDRIDNIITHRILGPIIFFVIMFFMFQAIYAWAELPMTWIEEIFASLSSYARIVLPVGWVSNLVSDGIIAGLGGIMVFIPQITILFLIIAVLEEIGYMSRAVFMFDGLMQRFGLNGRSIVSLISSGACAIPAIMATRTITDWKERLITIMVSPLISCSARIPVYAVLIGFAVPAGEVMGVFNTQGLAFMGLYLLGIAAALISAFVFKLIIKSESRSILMIELPQYKTPIWKNVILTLREKVTTFIVEAGKVILIVSIILWFLASYGPSKAMINAENDAITLAQTQQLDDEARDNLIASKKIEASYAGHLGKFIEPAIKPLGFDWKIGIALITSFAAREVFVGTMATIYSVGSTDDELTIRGKMAAERDPVTMKPRYDMPTSFSLLIFYVFAMQCMSTLAVTKRETKSWKWPIVQFSYMGIMAYFGSLLVYQLLA